MRKIILFFTLITFGCNNKNIIHIYSLDKEKVISVIDVDNYRFIINGKYNRIPNKNFVKLSMENVDPLGDQIQICWKSDGCKWEAVVHNSIIIESKLDTSQFKFSTTLPKDNRGIPNQKKFTNDGCAIFDFYRLKLIPNRGAIIEILD